MFLSVACLPGDEVDFQNICINPQDERILSRYTVPTTVVSRHSTAMVSAIPELKFANPRPDIASYPVLPEELFQGHEGARNRETLAKEIRDAQNWFRLSCKISAIAGSLPGAGAVGGAASAAPLPTQLKLDFGVGAFACCW